MLNFYSYIHMLNFTFILSDVTPGFLYMSEFIFIFYVLNVTLTFDPKLTEQIETNVQVLTFHRSVQIQIRVLIIPFKTFSFGPYLEL